MIYHYVNSFFIGVLVADMLERRFPDEFRDTVTAIAFNVLHFYSKIQIAFGKVQNIIFNFIGDDPVLSLIKNILNSIMKPKRDSLITYIKNGEYMPLEDRSKSDFALFEWFSDDEKCINRKIIYDLKEPDNNTDLSDVKKIIYDLINERDYSDVKFILLEIVIGENKKYKVDLKTDNYNFYLVGNKFTKQFFLYYLKQILAIDTTINNEETFVINIIDSDINRKVVELTGKDGFILLDKNEYVVSVT